MYQKPQFSAPHFPSHFTEYSPISSFMLIARLQPLVSISSLPRETTITLNCWGEGIDNVILARHGKRDNLRQMKQRYFWQKKSLSSRKRQMMRKNEISEDDTDDGNDSIINSHNQGGGKAQWRECWSTYDASCAQCETAFTKINQNFWHLRKFTVYSESELCSIFCESFRITATHFCEKTFSCKFLQ